MLGWIVGLWAQRVLQVVIPAHLVESSDDQDSQVKTKISIATLDEMPHATIVATIMCTGNMEKVTQLYLQEY